MVENTEFTDNIEKQVREILNVDDKKGIVETKGDAKDNNDIDAAVETGDSTVEIDEFPVENDVL